jgi:hypothetical protein
MLLDVLREIEDQSTKLASCLDRGDSGQASLHNDEIHRLVIEAAVLVLRQGPGIDALVPPSRRASARGARAGEPD